MLQRIVSLSPTGQITIPKIMRRNLSYKKFLLEFRDEILLLKPCKVMVKKKDCFVNRAIIDKLLSLSEEQKRIYNLIRFRPSSTDNISEKTGLDIGKVTVLLTELEINNIIFNNKYSLWEIKLD